ncbi:TPA: REP-associated tyrosine transposase, partial [Neisseria meningitidis]
MKYRRFYRNGGTYFFTVVANKRQKILTDDAVRLALRQAVMAVRERYPFEILAWVLMPDHLHTIWRLPD